jgi:hypothetical protein
MIGSTAFFAPPTVTSPCNGTPPLMRKLSMKCWSKLFRQIQPRTENHSRRAIKILER